MSNLTDPKRRWGVVLAGGDGVRLRPLTRFIAGDDRPKQFCSLYGEISLVEQTRRRAQRNIRADQILFSLNRAHEKFYLGARVDCPSQRVVQPWNQGTAAAILSCLFSIAPKDRDATVAVFPSDHYYSDENAIAEAVERAFVLSYREPEAVVLVGADPQSPPGEYGWIEPGASVGTRSDAFRVRAFCEKPSPPLARFLKERGALWNTFVMVGRVTAFLEMICSALPGILKPFQQFRALRAPNEELRISESLYDRLPSADFSRRVLSIETERLIVQRLGPVEWSDLGDCDRAVAALSGFRPEPGWAARWRLARPCREPGHAVGAASVVV